jgi:hypothetical protein
MAGTVTVAIYDLDVNDPDTDAVLVDAWQNTLSITHVYGWAVTPISNSRFRYSIVYD